jgi:hypothetical protein
VCPAFFVLFIAHTVPFLVSVGVFIGLILIQPSDIQGMHAHLSLLLEEYDITIPSIPDFDFSRVEEEWRKLRSNIPELWNFNTDRRDFQVGESMRDRGLSAQYPIILIPGVVSTVRADWLDLFFFLSSKLFSLNRASNPGLRPQNIVPFFVKSCGVASICYRK